MKIKILLVATTIILAGRVAWAADAGENWTKNCASCHGKDGSGNTLMGKKFGIKDYHDPKVQADLTDDQAFNIIKNGKDKMKSFKDKLTDPEIKALVTYIRGFKK